MTILVAIAQRYSVRNYLDKEVPNNIINQLKEEINTCNEESGLNIQLIINEPTAFGGMMAHYGKFSGVKYYIALIGKKCNTFAEFTVYY